MKICSKLMIGIAAMASCAALAGQCEVTVTWPDGQAKSGVRVVGAVSGGGMTEVFYTGSNGKVVITSSSDSKLKEVFVDGSSTGWECRDVGSV